MQKPLEARDAHQPTRSNPHGWRELTSRRQPIQSVSVDADPRRRLRNGQQIRLSLLDGPDEPHDATAGLRFASM